MRGRLLYALLGAAAAVAVLTIVRAPPGAQPGSLLKPSAYAPSPAELALDKVLPEVWIRAERFEPALAKLARLAGVEITVDWPALDAAGVDRGRVVDLRVRHVTLGDALDRVLRVPDTPVPLALAATPGTLVVTTRAETERTPIVRLYDLGDLLGPPDLAVPPPPGPNVQTCFGPAVTLAAREELVYGLIRLLTETAAPDSWRENGGAAGSMYLLADRLAVAQSWENHCRVRRLLADLREANAPAPSPAAKPELSPALRMEWHEALGKYVPTTPEPAAATLRRVLPEVALDDVPFDEAVAALARSAGTDVVLDRDAILANDGNLRHPVRLRLRGVPLAGALRRLVKSPGLRDLAYALDGGVIVVTTRERAERMVVTRVYDVRPLLPPRDASGAHEEAVERLTTMLTNTVEPDTWRDNGGVTGSVITLAAQLVVTQTWSGHEQVADLLAALRAGMEAPLPASPATAPTSRPRQTTRPVTAASAAVPARNPDAAVVTALERSLPDVSLTPATLDGALDALCEPAGVNVVVDWPALASAGVERARVLDRIRLRDATLEQALRHLLRSADATGGAASLGFSVRDGMLIVSTEERLSWDRVPRVYDVRDLLTPPSAEAGGGAAAASTRPAASQARMDALVSAVRDATVPVFTDANFIVRPFDGRLVVNAGWDVHRRLERVLVELRTTNDRAAGR